MRLGTADAAGRYPHLFVELIVSAKRVRRVIQTETSHLNCSAECFGDFRTDRGALSAPRMVSHAAIAADRHRD